MNFETDVIDRRVISLLAFAAGCTGVISDPGASPSGDDAPACLTAECEPATSVGRAGRPLPLRRLTNREYENTLVSLFGDPAGEPLAPEPGTGFENDAASLRVPEPVAERYRERAETIATALDVADMTGCALPLDSSECVRIAVDEMIRAVYRRPPTPGEVDALVALWEDEAAHESGEDAFRLVVEAMLQSPHFLYRVERGVPGADDFVELSDHEIATRLSYFLWADMPDFALREAADAGFAGPTEVERQARRMLDDDRARASVGIFVEEWLGLRALSGVDKADHVIDFDDALRRSMREEVRRFTAWAVFDDDARFETLLTAPVTFVDGRLASLYGVDAPAEPFGRVALDASERAGVLTQLGVLSVHASPTESDPIRRGKLVRERLLCQELPAPPDDVGALPEPDGTLSTRERFELHRSDPACAGCHRLMDPIGFGFEAYDAVGRFRTTDDGGVIDDRGELAHTRDIDGVFRGAVELAQLLASSTEVRDCFAQMLLQYALGRPLDETDAESVGELQSLFAASDGDIRELLVATTTTDSFLTP